MQQHLQALNYTTVNGGKVHVKPYANVLFDLYYQNTDGVHGAVKEPDDGSWSWQVPDSEVHSSLASLLREQFHSTNTSHTFSDPWLLVHSSTAPHGPHHQRTTPVHLADERRPWIHTFPVDGALPRKWPADPYMLDDQRGYFNDVQRLDREFEGWLDTIDHYFGNYERSVTIFLSDHGGKQWAKWSCYDAGLHVPFYLQLKGFGYSTPAGGRVNELLTFADILPSLMDMVGESLSADDVDGKSFVPLLRGKTVPPLNKFVFGMFTARGARCLTNAYPIRSAFDGRWKFIWNLNARNTTYQLPTTNNKATTRPQWLTWKDEQKKAGSRAYWANFLECRPEEELYDLLNDPHEENNLVAWQEGGGKPHQAKQILKTALLAWMVSQGDSPPTAVERELAIESKTTATKMKIAGICISELPDPVTRCKLPKVPACACGCSITDTHYRQALEGWSLKPTRPDQKNVPPHLRWGNSRTLATVEECAKLCMKDKDCRAFQWRRDVGSCVRSSASALLKDLVSEGSFSRATVHLYRVYNKWDDGGRMAALTR